MRCNSTVQHHQSYLANRISILQQCPFYNRFIFFISSIRIIILNYTRRDLFVSMCVCVTVLFSYINRTRYNVYFLHIYSFFVFLLFLFSSFCFLLWMVLESKVKVPLFTFFLRIAGKLHESNWVVWGLLNLCLIGGSFFSSLLFFIFRLRYVDEH